MPLTPLLLFCRVLLELDWSLDEPDFRPERVSAGVLVAFSCASPDELMCDCALSSPVDLDEDAPLLSLELVPEEAVPGLVDELPLFIDALPLVEAPLFIDALPLEEPVSDEDDAAPLYFDDELLDGEV